MKESSSHAVDTNLCRSETQTHIGIPPHERDSGIPDRLERLFVCAVWLILTVAGTIFIVAYGSCIPLRDDWSLIPFLAHENPLTLQWLWTPVAEHRIPLQKLTMWVLWKATGGDLRIAMLAGFIPLCIATLFVTRAARRARGRMEYTDAIFPLTLLHLGHAEVFLWWTTTGVPWMTALIALIGASMISREQHACPWRAGLVGFGLISLPLNNALSAVCSVPLIAGVTVIAIEKWRSRESEQRRLILPLLIGSALFTALLDTLYFTGLKPQHLQGTTPFSFRATLTGAIQYLTMAGGPAAARFWPLSAAVVVALAGATCALVLRPILKERGRNASHPLAAFFVLLAPVVGGLAVGMGRQFQGGLNARYAMYAAPLLCLVYLTWARFASQPLRRLVETSLFFVVCASFLWNTSIGLALGKHRHADTRQFLQDVGARMPLTAIVAEHQPDWGLNERSFRDGLQAMRDGHIGEFANIANDPPMEERAVSPSPIRAIDATYEYGIWRIHGKQSTLVFPVNSPGHVYAFRFTFVLRGKGNSTNINVSWFRSSEEDPFTSLISKTVHVEFNSAKSRRPETQTVWVDDDIRTFAISPSDEACEFQLKELSILTPARSN